MTTEGKKPSERVEALGAEYYNRLLVEIQRRYGPHPVTEDGQRMLAGLADIAAVKHMLNEEHERRQAWENGVEERLAKLQNRDGQLIGETEHGDMVFGRDHSDASEQRVAGMYGQKDLASGAEPEGSEEL